jgi:hypothetical protein
MVHTISWLILMMLIQRVPKKCIHILRKQKKKKKLQFSIYTDTTALRPFSLTVLPVGRLQHPEINPHLKQHTVVTKSASCSASWILASNARNMSRLWTLIKCKWKWSVYQVGCVYYVITTLWSTVNKTLNFSVCYVRLYKFSFRALFSERFRVAMRTPLQRNTRGNYGFLNKKTARSSWPWLLISTANTKLLFTDKSFPQSRAKPLSAVMT